MSLRPDRCSCCTVPEYMHACSDVEQEAQRKAFIGENVLLLIPIVQSGEETLAEVLVRNLRACCSR